MSEQLTLAAEARERAGKEASRAIRRQGRVPAVIYGDKAEPLGVHLEERALVKMMSGGHFMNSVVMIEVGGKANRTLPKDVQFHPVTDRPIHVDFLRIGEHAKVTLNVPVHFVDEEESPGLDAGGVLNTLAHELEISCDASQIPGEISISLKGLEIGGSIHLSDIELPEGAVATGEPDMTIATIAAPKLAVADEDEAPAADEVPASEQGGEGEAEAKAKDGEASEAE